MIQSDSFPIYLTKKASEFNQNYAPEVKNYPETIEIERERTEDLKFEYFISDINSDDGIAVSEATLDGQVLANDTLVQVNTKIVDMKVMSILISPEAVLLEKGSVLEITLGDIPPTFDD